MANEIQVNGLPNRTFYVVLVSAAGVNGGKFFNALTSALEVFSSANWVATKYPIALTEVGGAGITGIYTANAPAGLPAGLYSVMPYMQAGGSPALGDLFVGGGGGTWDFNGTSTDYLAIPAGFIR